MYSTFIAYLLWAIGGFGALGFHRFYLGKIPSGVLWMFTGGLCMIGSIYDFFTLSRQVENANIRHAFINGSPRSDLSSQKWRNINDGKIRIINEKDNVERVILKVAKENKGILSASDLALAANISIEESKKELDSLVTKGFAELRVRQSGTLVYAIPDLMDSDEPLVD